MVISLLPNPVYMRKCVTQQPIYTSMHFRRDYTVPNTHTKAVKHHKITQHTLTITYKVCGRVTVVVPKQDVNQPACTGAHTFLAQHAPHHFSSGDQHLPLRKFYCETGWK